MTDLVHPEDCDILAHSKRRTPRYLAKDGSYRPIEWLTTVFQNGRFHFLARELPVEEERHAHSRKEAS